MTRFFILMICLCWSCQDVNVPKPKAYLSLEYPKANYQNIEPQLPFTFDKNKLSTVETISKNKKKIRIKPKLSLIECYSLFNLQFPK